MTERYLSEFYSYRTAFPDSTRVDFGSNLPLERQVQYLLLQGNQDFIKSRYVDALYNYRTAWQRLTEFVDPSLRRDHQELREADLLQADLTDALVSVSVQLLRLRDSAGPLVPIVAVYDPGAGSPAILGRYRPLPAGKRTYGLAQAYAAAGENELATRHAEKLLSDPALATDTHADVRALLGVIAIIDENLSAGESHLQRALKLYQKTQDADGVAAMHYNIGVASALSGRYQEAVTLLGTAARSPSVGLSWHISQSTLPGVASFALDIEPPGLPLMIKDVDGRWLKLPSGRLPSPQKQFSWVRDGTNLTVDLELREAGIVDGVLAPRINATTLPALAINFTNLPVFVAHLAHVYGLVLPLSLGDTYLALGDTEQAERYFLKARAYRFLNLTVEKPFIWCRLAAVYLQRGQTSQSEGNIGEALRVFRQIIPPGLLAGSRSVSPLYAGVFADIARDARAFLGSDSPVEFSKLSHDSRLHLLDAAARLHRIEHEIDRFGIAKAPLPSRSWPSSLQFSRAMARKADEVNSIAQTVINSVERGEHTKSTLRQIVTANEVAVSAEEARLREIEELYAQALAAVDTAKTRLAKLEGEMQWLSGRGSRAAKLAAVKRRVTFLRKKDDLNTASSPVAGAYLTLLQRSTHRAQASRGEELTKLRNQLSWITMANSEAENLVAAAQPLVEDAKYQLQLSNMRLDRARVALLSSGAEDYTLEQARVSCQLLRDVSIQCSETTVGAAVKARTALALVHGPESELSHLDSSRSGNGLVGHDVRLSKIEGRADLPALQVEHRIPLRITISVAERWPHQFVKQFWETGRIEFETLLEDVDRLCPGAWLATLQRVGVELETETEHDRFHATLTRSAVSSYRDRDGTARIRVQAPERLTLSRYGELSALSHTPPSAFTGLPAAGGWVFELSPDLGHIDPRAICDVKLVLDCMAFYDVHLASLIMSKALTDNVSEHAVGFGVKARNPHDFSLLRTTGSVKFTIDQQSIPSSHSSPSIVDAYFAIDTARRTMPSGLILSVSSAASGTVVEETIDDYGVIGTDDDAARLNELRGQPLFDTWTIRLDRDRNKSLFAAGFRWDDVQDIHVLIDYAYLPQSIEPTQPRPIEVGGQDSQSFYRPRGGRA